MSSALTRRLIVHPERGSREEERVVPGDEQLLDRFLHGEPEVSEAAFRALVKRHGPMVMGVCRHVLNQDEDAEDAFQATFLTLARKAESIRDQRLLSAWLYEVAYRIAIRARSTAARRRDQEKAGAALTSMSTLPQHEHEAAWAELRPVLHDELNRLPEKYRLPIILSYLEGRTNEEVAGLLCWPVGTVKGRLSRARDLLRTRLLRRGLVLSAAFLCSAFTHGVTFAEVVPESLVARTRTRALRMRAVGEATQAGAPEPMLPGPSTAGPTPRPPTPQPAPRRGHARWLLGIAMHLFAALIVLAMLSSLWIFSDPGTTRRFKRTALYLTTGQSFDGCHTTAAATGTALPPRNDER
jgi:RNA polymerase sigma factor (sigma-70 family)